MTTPPLQIALLDDKEFGVQQIRNALPVGVAAEVTWFPDLPALRADVRVFDILFLDYYLDRDGITGDMAMAEVQRRAGVIIGFSSAESGNRHLLACGADHAVAKQWGTHNDALENLLLEILPADD